MNVKIFAALVVLNVVVWSVVLFVSGGSDDDKMLFTNLELDKVKAFSVKTDQGLTILRRSPVGVLEESVLYDPTEFGFWELVNPSGAPASAEVVAAVLLELGKLEYVKKEKVSDDTLRELGLDPAFISFDYAVEEAGATKTTRLELGKQSPISGVYYSRKLTEPNTVYSIDDKLYSILNIDSSLFRELYPFRLNIPILQTIEVGNRYGPWVINYRKDRGWFVSVSTGSFPVDEQEMSVLLNRIYSMKVKTFVDEFDGGLKQFGLADPSVTLRFFDGSSTNLLSFGRDIDGEKFYAKINSAPWVYELEGPWSSKLNNSPANLLSKQPYRSIRTDDIDMFIVSRVTKGKGESRVWEKTGDVWRSFYEEVTSSELLTRIKNKLSDGEIRTKSVRKIGSEEDLAALGLIMGNIRFLDYDFEAKEKLDVSPYVWEILLREAGRWWVLSVTSLTVDEVSGKVDPSSPLYGVAVLYGGELNTPVIITAGDGAIIADVVNTKLK